MIRNKKSFRALNSNSRSILTVSAAKSRVVLIVEDDVLLRMGAAEMVMDAGFDVVEAGNADEAMAILESHPDIHIIFNRHSDAQIDGRHQSVRSALPLLTDVAQRQCHF